MDFLSPNKRQHPLHRHLQTLWSNFTNRVPKFSSPFLSLSSSSFPSSSTSLSTFEIKRRMLGIPVYKVSDYSLASLTFLSQPNRDRQLELYCVGKPDAQDILHEIGTDDWQIFDTPLTHVAKFEGDRGLPPIRLIPEVSQVKNAIELRNKDRNKDEVDLSFSGVPIFQSDCLVIADERAEKTYSPAFFNKEDLEKHILKVVKPENRSTIKVSSLEDIIQRMKDDSTSESNDIFFVGPGITSWTWFLTDN